MIHTYNEHQDALAQLEYVRSVSGKGRDFIQCLCRDGQAAGIFLSSREIESASAALQDLLSDVFNAVESRAQAIVITSEKFLSL